MRQYGLSKIKLINILHRPDRQEVGIVSGTVAVMKTNKIFFKEKKVTVKKAMPTGRQAWQPKRSPGEIWIMFNETKNMRRIISAWRYPGISKPGEEIPIPKDIREEILNNPALA